MPSSNPLELIKPVGSVVRTIEEGKDLYFKKTASDTWVNMANLQPFSSTDPMIKRVLDHSEPISPARAMQLFTNPAISYNVLHSVAGTKGVSPNSHSSPGAVATFIDVESTVEAVKKDRALSTGYTAAGGTLHGMTGDKAGTVGAELMFLSGMDGAPGHPSTLRDAGYDKRIQKFSALAAEGVDEYLQRNGRLGTNIQAEKLTKLKKIHEYFGTSAKAFESMSHDTLKMGRSFNHEEWTKNLRDIQTLIGIDKSGDTPFGEGVSWLKLKDNRMLGIVDKGVTPSEMYNRYNEHIKGSGSTAYNYAYNAQHEEAVLGAAKGSIHDVRGAQMLQWQDMFKESGLDFSSSLGYMNPSLVKRLGVSKKVSQDIFASMSKGPGSMFGAGLNLQGWNNVTNNILRKGRQSEQHYGDADNQMAVNTFHDMSKIHKMVIDEEMGIRDPSAPAISVKQRTKLEYFKQVAAKAILDNDSQNVYKGSIESVHKMIDSKMTLTSKERSIAKEIERNAGHDMQRSLGSHLNPFGGGTVSAALAGAFLTTGISAVALKAQEAFGGDKQRLEGMRHESYLTMANRMRLSDFGSTPQFEAGALRSTFHTIGAAFSSFYEASTAAGQHNFLTAINNDIKDVADGKGLFKTLDRRLAKTILRPIHGAYISGYANEMKGLRDLELNGGKSTIREREALREWLGGKATYTEAATRGVQQAYNQSIKLGFFGSAGHDIKTVVGQLRKNPGSAKAIGKSALRSLGSMFVMGGKVTGVGMLTGLGIAGGALMALGHGSYEPNHQYDPYNPDKVKNDPRFKERRARRLNRLLRDARTADMDGLEATSPSREGNRLRLTDFGSGMEERGSIGNLIGEVKFNDSSYVQALQKENEMVVGAKMMGEGNSTNDSLINSMGERPTLGLAELVSQRTTESFLGANRDDRGISYATMTPDRSTLALDGPTGNAPLTNASPQEITELQQVAVSQKVENVATGVQIADADVVAHTARDSGDVALKMNEGAARSENIVSISTPNRDDGSPKEVITDITSPTISKSVRNIPVTASIDATPNMRPPQAPMEKTIITHNEPVVTPGSAGKEAGRIVGQAQNASAGEKSWSGMGPALRPVDGLQGYITSLLREPASTPMSAIHENTMKTPYGTTQGIRGGNGYEAVASAVAVKGGEAMRTINPRVSVIGSSPAISRPLPAELRTGSARESMVVLQQRDQAMSNMMANFNDRFSSAHLGYTGNGQKSAYLQSSGYL